MFIPKKIPIIVGPTAVGKTELSLLLAKAYGGEVISADSRQFYKYMDIGTAKVAKSIQQKIQHHFIDILEPSNYYSAGMFASDARKKITEIQKKGVQPIVAGGSGLYIRALIDGIFELDAKDPKLRAELLRRADTEGLGVLYEELKQVDPVYAAKVSSNDKQRISRALEVYHISGRSFSEWHCQEPKSADFIPLFVGLNSEREVLYKRINERVDQMLEHGLLNEVKKLNQLGFNRELNSLNTVGYKEAFAYHAGEISRDEMCQLIKRNSRRYAKRQLTWFKSDERIHWFDVIDSASLTDTSKSIIKLMN